MWCTKENSFKIQNYTVYLESQWGGGGRGGGASFPTLKSCV